MAALITNNAAGTLNGSIADDATSLALNSGQGALFPSPSGGTYFYATLVSSTLDVEIIKVTARSTDTFSTIVRAQDGTSALAFADGDVVEIRPIAALFAEMLKPDETATISKGYTLTPYSAGTKSSGTFTPAPADGNYQYATNGGAHTLAAPSSDCAIDLYYLNNASAGAITMSGFTVGANTGDTYTTTDTYKFILSIRRIDSVSAYVWKALQ